MFYNKNGLTNNNFTINQNRFDVTIGSPNSATRKKPTYIKKFIIFRDVIIKTKTVLVGAGRHKKEGLVFWSGVLNADNANIKTVICPKNISTSISARLDNEGMEYIRNVLKKNNEFLFAQVHSHPGIAFHSDDDCNEAISYKKGFISIVVPDYGRDMDGLNTCAIFEYVGNGVWNELSTKIVNERFKII